MSAPTRTTKRPKRQATSTPRHPFDVVLYAPWAGPLLTTAPAPPTGGAETQLVLLARALAKQNIRVCLVSYPTDGPLPTEFDGVVVRVQRRIVSRLRLAQGLISLLSLIRTLGPLRSRVIVQRSAGPETGCVALLARALGRRFVYSSANVVDFEYERLEGVRRRVRLFHMGVRLAHEVVVQTLEQVGMCERRFGRTPTVIKSIAEPAEPRVVRPEAFLWIGRMAAYKRPEAFLRLASDVPEAQFWMIGNAAGGVGRELADEVEALAEHLPNLKLLAPRPRDRLPELIERSVAMVNTGDFEGMPNIFLESWARGVPALSLTHDPDGVIRREGLGRFADGSRTRFAEYARELWRTRHDQDLLASRCRAYVHREHSPVAVAQQWIDALRLAEG
jgi:glycosyltransferase involved in cell wall biosynthesis